MYSPYCKIDARNGNTKLYCLQPHVTTKLDDARLAKQLEQAEAETRQVAGDDDDEDDDEEEDDESGAEEDAKPATNGEVEP